MCQRLLLLIILALLLVACGSERIPGPAGGPQLLMEITLPPAAVTATRALSPTPSPLFQPLMVSVTPLTVLTLEPGFDLITPTLPPSKTPTLTPTHTPVLTATPRSSVVSSSPLATAPAGLVPIPTPVGESISPASCAVSWFFSVPQWSLCPLSDPLVSAAAFQPFESGYMIQIAQQDAIYVLFGSASYPRWQVMKDTFKAGMPETDPDFDTAPVYADQPRQGFGMLWRNQPLLQARLGWALTERPIPYQGRVQLASDGTIFISEPRGGVFSLTPDGSEWRRYDPLF